MRNDIFLVMSLAILALFSIASCRSSESPVQLSIESDNADKVCLEESCFTVEVADTYALRQKGLMYRDRLDEDKGMLFVFDEPGFHRFWMKNTFIPLDIIWIDDNGSVIHVSENTPQCAADPCPSYGPPVKASYVLELNAGMAAKSRIVQGSRMEIALSDQ